MKQLILLGHRFVHPASLPGLREGRTFANGAEAFIAGRQFEEVTGLWVEGWKLSQTLPLLSVL